MTLRLRQWTDCAWVWTGYTPHWGHTHSSAPQYSCCFRSRPLHLHNNQMKKWGCLAVWGLPKVSWLESGKAKGGTFKSTLSDLILTTAPGSRTQGVLIKDTLVPPPGCVYMKCSHFWLPEDRQKELTEHRRFFHPIWTHLCTHLHPSLTRASKAPHLPVRYLPSRLDPDQSAPI